VQPETKEIQFDPYSELERAEGMFNGLFRDFFGDVGNMIHSEPMDAFYNQEQYVSPESQNREGYGGYMHTESFTDGKMEKHDYVLDSQGTEGWHERQEPVEETQEEMRSNENQPEIFELVYDSPFSRPSFSNWGPIDAFSSLSHWNPFQEARPTSLMDSFFNTRVVDPFPYNMPIKVYAFSGPEEEDAEPCDHGHERPLLGQRSTENQLQMNLLGQQMESVQMESVQMESVQMQTAQLNEQPAQLLTSEHLTHSHLPITGAILGCILLVLFLFGMRRACRKNVEEEEEEESTEMIDEYVEMDKPVKYVVTSINEKPIINKRNLNEKLLGIDAPVEPVLCDQVSSQYQIPTTV